MASQDVLVIAQVSRGIGLPPRIPRQPRSMFPSKFIPQLMVISLWWTYPVKNNRARYYPPLPQLHDYVACGGNMNVP